ncbi:hypothetical protein RRG08_014753 [Elysia crispata]|uniref:Uncharacterized protein n=1 Tax=Elysia crispata TaxID=231223 RepID=A0AAE1E4J3_9GAST|nr:hypothetical protein RRG08_014753 [Elysia crispata]
MGTAHCTARNSCPGHPWPHLQSLLLKDGDYTLYSQKLLSRPAWATSSVIVTQRWGIQTVQPETLVPGEINARSS